MPTVKPKNSEGGPFLGLGFGDCAPENALKVEKSCFRKSAFEKSMREPREAEEPSERSPTWVEKHLIQPIIEFIHLIWTFQLKRKIEKKINLEKFWSTPLYRFFHEGFAVREPAIARRLEGEQKIWH